MFEGGSERSRPCGMKGRRVSTEWGDAAAFVFLKPGMFRRSEPKFVLLTTEIVLHGENALCAFCAVK